jgi:hypothetical protein
MFFDTLKNGSALRLFYGSSWMATPPARLGWPLLRPWSNLLAAQISCRWIDL